MITYFVRPFSSPTTVDPGDRFNLYVRGEKVCTREIMATEVISHWAYVQLPGTGVAYFIGNEKLTEVLAERFPDAEIEKNPKMT